MRFRYSAIPLLAALLIPSLTSADVIRLDETQRHFQELEEQGLFFDTAYYQHMARLENPVQIVGQIMVMEDVGGLLENSTTMDSSRTQAESS